jgi:hypothetical protein
LSDPEINLPISYQQKQYPINKKTSYSQGFAGIAGKNIGS